jgi:hypothetical protein
VPGNGPAGRSFRCRFRLEKASLKIRSRAQQGPSGGGIVARLMVKSSGPDRKKDTDDDIKDHSNFITIEEGRLEPIDMRRELKGKGSEK